MRAVVIVALTVAGIAGIALLGSTAGHIPPELVYSHPSLINASPVSSLAIFQGIQKLLTVWSSIAIVVAVAGVAVTAIYKPLGGVLLVLSGASFAAVLPQATPVLEATWQDPVIRLAAISAPIALIAAGLLTLLDANIIARIRS
jgi:sulfite exporter TauE/SafE